MIEIEKDVLIVFLLFPVPYILLFLLMYIVAKSSGDSFAKEISKYQENNNLEGIKRDEPPNLKSNSKNKGKGGPTKEDEDQEDIVGEIKIILRKEVLKT